LIEDIAKPPRGSVHDGDAAAGKSSVPSPDKGWDDASHGSRRRTHATDLDIAGVPNQFTIKRAAVTGCGRAHVYEAGGIGVVRVAEW
jgi:hypothetical protein